MMNMESHQFPIHATQARKIRATMENLIQRVRAISFNPSAEIVLICFMLLALLGTVGICHVKTCFDRNNNMQNYTI